MPSAPASGQILARGTSGRLMVGYLEAAHLGAWSLEVPDGFMAAGGWIVRAAISHADDFWYHVPGRFDLRLAAGAREWCWDGAECEGNAATVTCRGSGSPEVQ